VIPNVGAAVEERHERMRRKAPEAAITVLAASGILTCLYLRFLLHPAPYLEGIPLYVAMAVGGVPLLWRLRICSPEYQSWLRLGQFLVRTIIVLMFSGGNPLES
jgi:hypothetical protein